MGGFTVGEYNRIKLDGICREGKELHAYCTDQLKEPLTPQWQRYVWQFIQEWLSPQDYILAHTSGSTGRPKEVRLLKRHMLASAQKTVTYFNLTADKTALLCLSARYIAGKMMLVRALVGGFNLLLTEPSGTPLSHISLPLDFVAMVPLQVYHSIADLTNVKTVIIGGGAVSLELKQRLQGRYTRFYESYGMTETVSHVAIRELDSREGFFKAMPNVRFEQDDRSCLKIIASDICEGEVVTNDIVKLNNKHEFLFIGRYDHIINTGGLKVVPEQIESKLSNLLSVPFLISSVPDDRLGEKIVLVFEENNIPMKLPDFSLVLSKYESPKEIKCIREFPLTETGKIKRKEVKRLMNDGRS